MTYQATPGTRTSFLVIPHLKERFHRRNAPYLAIEDKATVNNPLDTTSYVGKLNRVFGDSLVFDASFGRIWGSFSNFYEPDVRPDDIDVSDTVRFTRFNAAPEDQTNPNHRYQLNTSMSYFAQNRLGGSHDSKVGLQISREKMLLERRKNGDIELQLRDGAAFQALLANTPNRTDHRLNGWDVFVQDRWRAGKLTLNLGVRFDGVESYLPSQTSPAGTWVGERNFAETEVFRFRLNAAPRLGAAYDVFGNGRTALKAYFGRFYNQFGSDIPEAVNLNSVTTVQVPWRDLNNNTRHDPGELDFSGFVGFPPGLFPVVDPNARRPYSDEVSAGVDHQFPRDLALAVSYHRRQHRDGLTIVDRARPAAAYTPLQRTYLDAGATRTITVYNLDPALRTRRERVLTNADPIRSDYDGLEVTITKKMSNRWQMLGGLSVQKHEGFTHNGTFTNPGNNTDLNNPNFGLNRDAGAVFTDLPWSFKIAGSYMLPLNLLVAGKYQGRAGEPLERTLVVTGLNQGSETIFVQQRGRDRTEAVTAFIDARVSKRFSAGRWQAETALDIYNLVNANPVLAQNTAIGTTWGRPTRILAPRVIRLGFSARF